MTTISIHSATAASYLSVSFAAVLLSIQSFWSEFPDTALAVALIVLSFITITAGITSASATRVVSNILLLLLTTVWMSLGMNKLWTGINKNYNITSATDDTTEYLLPGYGTSLVVILLLLTVSVYNQSLRHVAVLCTIIAVLFTFEIITIWVSIQMSGAVYIVLVGFLNYFWLSTSLQGFCGPNSISPIHGSNRLKNTSKSYDFCVIWYATNAISYSIFAFQMTSVSNVIELAFSWPMSAGIVQLILGVASLRKHDIINSIHMILYGFLWLSIGIHLWLEILYASNINFSVPISVILVTCFLALSVINVKLEILRSASCFTFALFLVSICIEINGIFVGVAGFIGLFVSLYGVMGHLFPIADFRFCVPTGAMIFDKKNFWGLFKCCQSQIKPEQTKGSFSAEVMLGYSKYMDVQCLGFLVNAIAALSIIPSTISIGSLPFCLGFGGIVQFIIGFVAFSRGLTFESCSYLVYAMFWSIWGSISILGITNNIKDVSVVSGCISFFAIGVTLIGLSTTVSLLWFCISCCFSLLVLSFVISGSTDGSTEVFQTVIASLFATILIYAFIGNFLKNMFGRAILPLGRPMISISLLTTGVDKTILADSRRATGVRQIADMMSSGKICGIPTDTVYILTAACNQPAAVERAYKTKKLAEDRPMSVWLSNLNQIHAAKPEFGPLLWDFLTEIWPSNISAVVKRGDWVKSLGLGDSEKYIGKPDSIAIRIPDSSITCHLIDQTGPIAVTSANPTGEADTTHHWQVIAKLGDTNCDGVLCDGPSPENAASTVVDCRNVDNGKIGFFRIGLTPKSNVEDIFQRVLLKHKKSSDGNSDSGVSTDINHYEETGKRNDAFVKEEIPLTETKGQPPKLSGKAVTKT